MADLQVKQIDFLGNTLMAAQDNDGIIWAGVRWLCDGIGLTEGQRKYQISVIKNDRVLSRSGRNFILNGTGGGDREVFCIKLDYVPMWLAKINITTTMESDSPDVADRLEQYQLKAKDVLAAAFLPQQKSMSTAEIVALMAQNNVEMERKVAALESKSQEMENKVNILSRSPDYWRAEMEERIKQMAKAKGIMEKVFRARLYEELERVESPLDLDNRLTRMRNRARKQGALHRNCAAFTKLDVIAQNKTLQDAFEAIVDEYDTQLTIGGNA